MYSLEQRIKAVELYIKYDFHVAKFIKDRIRIRISDIYDVIKGV
ncbi:MAG: hypothetical protein ACYDG2_15530 [Ruminiclostridium sp.]